MVMKLKREDSTPICGKKTFKFLARMARNGQASPYKRMDLDTNEKKSNIKKVDEKKTEEYSKGKENSKAMSNKEVKEKKSKKKGWKRFRQVALTTCRYIGMGAAHMSPATAYSSPDYFVDPKVWNKSFSSSYRPKVVPQSPHWASTMMYSAW